MLKYSDKIKSLENHPSHSILQNHWITHLEKFNENTQHISERETKTYLKNNKDGICKGTLLPEVPDGICSVAVIAVACAFCANI